MVASMAPLPIQSLVESVQKSESFRESTRDYLIRAAQLMCPNETIRASNGMNRYYQIQVNSLFNGDQDDINYISRLSEKNTRCIRCGNQKKIRLRSRRRENKSSDRKYCRYLRSLCNEYCDKCDNIKTYKLTGRQSIIDKLKKPPVPKLATKRVVKLPLEDKPLKKKNIVIKPVALEKPPQKTAPFSSRLRAFSCLLQE